LGTGNETKHKALATALLLSLAAGVAARANQSDNFIGATVTKPAQKWEEALLGGNGTMGVMMYGEPYLETLILNHHECYLSIGNKRIVEDLAKYEFEKAGLAAGRKGPDVVHENGQWERKIFVSRSNKGKPQCDYLQRSGSRS
jgi:hypothetical protein